METEIRSERTNGHVSLDVFARSLLVAYASETGSSQDYAEDLDQSLQRLHYRTELKEMNDVPLSTLQKYSLVIFVVSTTGQGDMPRNAGQMWKRLLRKKLPPDCLSGMKFTTFGLGDSAYQKFNWAARKLHKRLEQLGGQDFFPRGEADERHPEGSDPAYSRWSTELRAHLLTIHPLPDGVTPIPPDVYLPPKYLLEFDAMKNKAKFHPELRHVSEEPAEKTPSEKDHAEKGGDAERAETSGIDIDLMSELQLNPPGMPKIHKHLPAAAWTHEGPELTSAARDYVKPKRTGAVWEGFDKANQLQDHPHLYGVNSGMKEVSSSPHNRLLPVPDSRTCVLVSNDRVTPTEHWQDVRTLHFDVVPDVDGRPFQFSPGDTIVMHPKNGPDHVNSLIKWMGWEEDADSLIIWPSDMPRPSNLYICPNFTLRDLLIHNLDIMAIPKRKFFKAISQFAANPEHKDRLLDFIDWTKSEEYYDYAPRPRRSILEVLEEFTSVRIPSGLVLDVFPVMRGRQFSVARAYELGDGFVRIEIIVALVQYKSILQRQRRGLCSRYIEGLVPGSQLNVTHYPSQTILYGPRVARRPLLAIATGTGIAPIRALIYERLQHKDVGEMYLIFGCRQEEMDFHYHEEWQTLADKGVLKVYTAFSRDPQNPRYVQHAVEGLPNLVRRVIAADGIFFVCGGSPKMAIEVQNRVLGIMRAAGMARSRADLAQLNWHEEIW